LYIGKQQRDIRARFENGKRFRRIDGLNRRESSILDNVDRAHSQHHFVLYNENVRRGGGWT
jgi:hypothetical protein